MYYRIIFMFLVWYLFDQLLLHVNNIGIPLLYLISYRVRSSSCAKLYNMYVVLWTMTVYNALNGSCLMVFIDLVNVCASVMSAMRKGLINLYNIATAVAINFTWSIHRVHVDLCPFDRYDRYGISRRRCQWTRDRCAGAIPWLEMSADMYSVLVDQRTPGNRSSKPKRYTGKKDCKI